MAVRLPTLEQIDNLGSDFGLVLTADEVAAFQQAFKGPLASYGRLEELVPPALAPVAPRYPDIGRRHRKIRMAPGIGKRTSRRAVKGC
jgi:hypothetical protein